MIARTPFIPRPYLNIELNEDKSNVGDFFAADVIAGKSFAQNSAGWVQNDVDRIIRERDESTQQALLQRLQEIPTNGHPADADNTALLMSLRSRYSQTASEVTRFIEQQLEIQQINSAPAPAAEPPAAPSVEPSVES